jgi:cyclic di-GMP phosphodiesterase
MDAYDAVLEVVGEVLNLRSYALGDHSKRVTAYTITIVRKMELPKEQLAVIARGAFLHDIGKIGIPDAILFKPAKLTDDEMTIMREHSHLGYKTIKNIPFLSEAAEIVYAHHERWDGTGYPRELRGEQILLGARIVALANTLDVVTSDQPYGPARSFEAARNEIERCSGSQFDPQIVKAFLETPHDMWEELCKISG